MRFIKTQRKDWFGASVNDAVAVCMVFFLQRAQKLCSGNGEGATAALINDWKGTIGDFGCGTTSSVAESDTKGLTDSAAFAAASRA